MALSDAGSLCEGQEANALVFVSLVTASPLCPAAQVQPHMNLDDTETYRDNMETCRDNMEAYWDGTQTYQDNTEIYTGITHKHTWITWKQTRTTQKQVGIDVSQ